MSAEVGVGFVSNCASWCGSVIYQRDTWLLRLRCTDHPTNLMISHVATFFISKVTAKAREAWCYSLNANSNKENSFLTHDHGPGLTDEDLCSETTQVDRLDEAGSRCGSTPKVVLVEEGCGRENGSEWREEGGEVA